MSGTPHIGQPNVRIQLEDPILRRFRFLCSSASFIRPTGAKYQTL